MKNYSNNELIIKLVSVSLSISSKLFLEFEEKNISKCFCLQIIMHNHEFPRKDVLFCDALYPTVIFIWWYCCVKQLF